MNTRLLTCIVGLFVFVQLVQPVLAQVRAVGSSGNSESSNPENWTMAVVSPDDENLYVIDTEDGSTTFVRGLRNNVDAKLADDGWTEPFWGESYRDGQHIAYNPEDGLLYHRNGTIGYRNANVDPRAYDARLIETYDAGTDSSITDSVNDRVDTETTPSGMANHTAAGLVLACAVGMLSVIVLWRLARAV